HRLAEFVAEFAEYDQRASPVVEGFVELLEMLVRISEVGQDPGLAMPIIQVLGGGQANMVNGDPVGRRLSMSKKCTSGSFHAISYWPVLAAWPTAATRLAHSVRNQAIACTRAVEPGWA